MSNRGYNQISAISVIALLVLAITVYAEDPPAAGGGAPDETFTQRELIANIQHSHSLKCGMCIGGGYDFCWKSSVGGKVLGPEDDPYYESNSVTTTTGSTRKKNLVETTTVQPDFVLSSYVCCQNELDPLCQFLYGSKEEIEAAGGTPVDKSEWICSYSFGNTAYSMHICPFVREECGPNSIINFYKEQEDGAVHIKNLDKGDACVYNIQSVCGAPAVRVNNATGTQIFYSEWQQDAIPLNTPRTELDFDSTEVKTSSPFPGMPIRNQQFIFDKGDGAITDRNPVFGIHTQVGWKSWGNKDQIADTSELGPSGRRYDDRENTCKLRNMQVAIIAMQDDVQMLLEVESQKFNAIYLKWSMVVLLSIASIYFI